MLKTRSQARLVPFFLPHAFLKRMPADTGLYCHAKSLHTSQKEATAYNGLRPPTGVASHLPPSVKISYAHMLYLHSGLVPPMHYITGYLHAVFTTAYNMPIKYLYSSHILATIKISCAIHACWPRTTYIIHYLIHAGGLG
jgi:hypothetical protein